eukprot:5666050-Lingulodinium_polyedra.AAC.1
MGSTAGMRGPGASSPPEAMRTGSRPAPSSLWGEPGPGCRASPMRAPRIGQPLGPLNRPEW